LSYSRREQTAKRSYADAAFEGHSPTRKPSDRTRVLGTVKPAGLDGLAKKCLWPGVKQPWSALRASTTLSFIPYPSPGCPADAGSCRCLSKLADDAVETSHHSRMSSKRTLSEQLRRAFSHRLL